MSLLTDFLKLFKWNTSDANDLDEEFDIDTAMNENWDKINANAKTVNQKLETMQTKLDTLENYDDTEIKQDIADIQAENDKQDKVIQQLQANMINETTDEATSLHVTNAAELPARLEVRGNHKQDGTPTIETTVEIEAVGDNKFDGEVLIGKGYNSSTGALQDNSYTFCNKNMIEVKPSAKLTISQNKNIFTTRFFFYNENKEYLSDAVNNSEIIDIPSDCYYVNFQATKETVRENYNNIKIELSNYTGNIQGYERITKMNKNFFNVPSSNRRGVDLELQEDGSYKINGTSTTSWVYRYGDYIWLTKGKYTISVENLNVGSTFFGIMRAGIKYETNTNYTFTLQKDSLVRCYFTCANAVNFENAVVKVQLEKSEAKTEWVKHEEQSYILPIQQEMLQGDYFIKEADGWKEVHLREKRLIKDSISNAYSSASKNSIYISQLLQDTAKIPANNNEDALILSNFAIHATQAELASASIDYGIALSDTGSLCIRCKNLSTVDEYKTALNNDSYYYYYYLATPSKLACTEAQSQVLDQLSELELFKGTNNIITAEDLALLQMTYTVDTKAYIDSKLGSEG